MQFLYQEIIQKKYDSFTWKVDSFLCSLMVLQKGQNLMDVWRKGVFFLVMLGKVSLQVYLSNVGNVFFYNKIG